VNTELVGSRERQLLDHLNDRQREAVLHGEGPLLVLAGAGSGKTRVLTHRVSHLVHTRGVNPRHILAFTFTNKAAREMKTRIVALIGDVPGLWVGTFHGICLRMLRNHAELVERTPSFSIYDADDQHALIKACLKALELSDRDYRPRAVHGQISRAKDNLLDHEAFEASARTAFDHGVSRIYREYDRRLKEANAFDFDDLILRTIGLFRRHPEVLGRYTERFRHVLVDEYQDTNHAQYILISLLASLSRNLAVVGDDDQSIYGWRGADIGNILSFEETYADAKVIRLEQNYRSTKVILKAAHQVVSRNRGRKPKELWTENAEGESIRLWVLPDEEREADAIVGEITAEVGRGHVTLRDAVVLYRTHAQSRPLEAALRRQGIAYELVGGVSFYERREVKDVLAYLRLLTNPGDDVSFLRIINVPRRGIGPTSVERLEAWARKRGLSLRAAAQRVDEIDELGTPARTRFSQFNQLFERLPGPPPVAGGGALTAADRITQVIAEIRYLDHLEEDDPNTAEGRRENLDELVAAAAHFGEVTGDPTIEGFLSEVALVAPLDRWDENVDRVTLMTVHNAKGLEFALVCVAGLEQGLFPHSSSFDDPRQLEEERRLFYVALTRARRRVVLSSARLRRRMGGIMESALSDFLHELPEELLEIIDRSGYDFESRRPVERRPARRLPAPPAARAEPHFEPDPDASWTQVVGARVFHAQFGRGVVVGQEGNGPDARLTVRFGGAIVKRVVARYLTLIGG
jgi:DNA helicase-2/ATP-dependent DNA helicase PcrA